MPKSFIYRLSITIPLVLFLMFSFSNVFAQKKKGILEINFQFMANGKRLVLTDSIYTNALGEKYAVSKLKLYLGHFQIGNHNIDIPGDRYILIDAAKEHNQVITTIDCGTYNYFGFNIGVDSADNCSGAQEGSLRPENDMFWTWNSGYIAFKLEGKSSSSHADLNRIEYHIGGYKNATAIFVPVGFSLHSEMTRNILNRKIIIKPNRKIRMMITLDLDKLWGGPTNLSIATQPVCMSPGPNSVAIANNFSQLFSIDFFDVP